MKQLLQIVIAFSVCLCVGHLSFILGGERVIPIIWGVPAVAVVLAFCFPKVSWLGIYSGCFVLLYFSVNGSPNFSLTASLGGSFVITTQSYVARCLYLCPSKATRSSFFRQILPLLLIAILVNSLFNILGSYIVFTRDSDIYVSFFQVYLAVLKANFIGFCLFFPITFFVFVRGVKNHFAMISVVLFAGLYTSFWLLNQNFQNLREENKQSDVNNAFSSLEVSLQEKETEIQLMLFGLKEFLNCSEFISYKHFSTYAKSIIKRSSYVRALEWIPMVPHDQRTVFEKKMQQNYPGYRFKDIDPMGLKVSLKHDVYYPVHYVTPYLGNEKAHGLNLGSNQERLIAIERAMSLKDSIVVTAPIDLVQNSKESKKGFLALLSLSKKSSKGLVLMVMDGSSILQDINKWVSPSLKLSIFDSKDSTALFLNDKVFVEAGYQRKYSFFNRTFVFHLESKFKRQFFGDRSYWIIYLCLGLLSTLMMFLIYTFETKKKIENEVLLQTEELIQAKERAELYTTLKSQFLANISHELRTPLHGISGYSELILLQSTDIVSKGHAEQIKNSSAHLTLIINDILDLAKVESGELHLYPRKVDVSSIVEDVCEWLQPKITKKHLELRWKTPVNMPTVVIDPIRFRQILLNLLGNAIKFTENGFVGVEIFWDTKDMTVAISDSGKGIASSSQNNIFKPFIQEEAGLNRKHGGTGLGLSITKELIEKMNGKVFFESSPGNGSCFTCVFHNVIIKD